MSRKVLLIEPNYKNKYPPMSLMKLATYFRNRGDDVRFYKGNMQDFAVELICEDLIKIYELRNAIHIHAELKKEIEYHLYMSKLAYKRMRPFIDQVKRKLKQDNMI